MTPSVTTGATNRTVHVPPRDPTLQEAWDDAIEAAAAVHPNLDVGLRRHGDGTGYAWAAGYGGEPDFYIEVDYPIPESTPIAALMLLTAKLRTFRRWVPR